MCGVEQVCERHHHAISVKANELCATPSLDQQTTTHHYLSRTRQRAQTRLQHQTSFVCANVFYAESA